MITQILTITLVFTFAEGPVTLTYDLQQPSHEACEEKGFDLVSAAAATYPSLTSVDYTCVAWLDLDPQHKN